MSRFVVAIGTLMLLGALGLAVGTTAIGDPRRDRSRVHGFFQHGGILDPWGDSRCGGRGDLAKRLGFDGPNRVMATFEDPKTAAVFAAATGMSTDEA